MNECTLTRGVLTTFVAHDRPDLPDSVALHMDACESCRDHFDALLTPPALPVPAAPAHLRASANRRSPAVAVLSLVAAALLAVVGAGLTHASSQPAPPDLRQSIVESLDADAVCMLDEFYTDSPDTCPLDLT